MTTETCRDSGNWDLTGRGAKFITVLLEAPRTSRGMTEGRETRP
jgi:hypothetical protein